jgi:hypothetical protein
MVTAAQAAGVVQEQERACSQPHRRSANIRLQEQPKAAGTLVICPTGSLLTGVSSLISGFPKNILVPT